MPINKFNYLKPYAVQAHGSNDVQARTQHLTSPWSAWTRVVRPKLVLEWMSLPDRSNTYDVVMQVEFEQDIFRNQLFLIRPFNYLKPIFNSPL